MRRRFYQILNVGVALETDSEELLDLIATDYSWFGTEAISTNKMLSVSAALHNQEQEPRLKINEEIHSLRDHPNPAKQAYTAIIEKLMGKATEFLILHAAVMARDGEALIIAGPPGSGKTTLALELLKRGFTFFSDDFCPIHHESRLVHPFPRSLWISTKSSKGLRRNKRPVPVEELNAKIASRPCLPTCLVCLHPEGADNPFCHIELGLKSQGSEPFLGELQALPDVTIGEIFPVPGPVGPGEGADSRQFNGSSAKEFDIVYPKGQGLTQNLARIFKKHRHHLWNVYRVEVNQPDFSRDPALTPLSIHEAAFYLLRDFKGQPGFLEDTSPCLDSAGKLFLKLAELLSRTSCYRLIPGPLERMVEHVLWAFDRASRKSSPLREGGMGIDQEPGLPLLRE